MNEFDGCVFGRHHVNLFKLVSLVVQNGKCHPSDMTEICGIEKFVLFDV